MRTITFKTLLDEALELNNMTINALANKINVQRPWLQHALVGRRNLSYEHFERIMNTLQVSEHMNKELREVFAREYYGDTHFNVVENAISILNEMADFEKNVFFSDNTTSQVFENIILEYDTTENKLKFFNALNDIVQNELEKELPVFYTDYSLLIDGVRKLFLNTLVRSSKTIDYKHVVYNEPAISEQDTISLFLYQYELAGYGYNSYYAPMNADTVSCPLPYFVLTSDTVIFFSKDLEFYITNNDPLNFSYMTKYFMNVLSTSFPLCHYMRSKEDFTKFTSLMPQSGENLPTYYYDLSANLCMASYLNTDILADSIPDVIEHKDYFVQGIANVFQFYAITPHTAVWEDDSLMKFVENDTTVCDYHNVTFDVLCISPENKLKMLKKLRTICEENISNNFITMPRKFKVPSFFHINAYEHGFVLGFNFKILDIADGKSYISTAISKDPILNNCLKNLTEYVVHSPYVYSTSKDYALMQINNAISYYCKKHGFNPED